mmetsp:Transcript_9226/g.20588  ORF Transcript_9226/g.20588 Transcript_9226/m.20588 type:complete len:777 (-) Transcript_9226:29-2359(-)
MGENKPTSRSAGDTAQGETQIPNVHRSPQIFVVMPAVETAADGGDQSDCTLALRRLFPEALRAGQLNVTAHVDDSGKGREFLAISAASPAGLAEKLRASTGQQLPTKESYSDAEVLEMMYRSIRSAPILSIWPRLTFEESGMLLEQRMSCNIFTALQEVGMVSGVIAMHEPQSQSRLCSLWRPWRLVQPLPEEEILGYYGNHAFHYFAFLHEYVKWLLLPALLGCIFWMLDRRLPWGVVPSVSVDTVTDGSARESSGYMELFTALLGICSTLWLEDWKRMFAASKLRHNSAASSDEEAQLLVPRRFVQRHSQVEIIFDPLPRDSSGRHLWTVTAVLAMIAATSAIIHALFLFGDAVEAFTDNVIVNILPILLYVVIVGGCQSMYERLARWLTDLENHCLRDEYLKSMTLKKALFALINYHGWFLYVAFWKRDMELLRSQLFVFMTAKQVIGNFVEALVPRLQDALANRSSEGDDLNAEKISSLLQRVDRELAKPKPSMFDEYVEMAVMFGVMCAYAPVLPLGPLLVLTHAVFESSSDMYKLCYSYQRLLPKHSDEVEAETWIAIFDALSLLGVMISIALIGVAFPDAWTSRDLIIAEHALLIFKGYLAWSIPDVPEWIQAMALESKLPPRHKTASFPQRGSRMVEVNSVRVTGLALRSWLRRPVVRLRSGDQTFALPIVEGTGNQFTAPMDEGSFRISCEDDLQVEVLIGQLRSFGRSYRFLGSVTFPLSSMTFTTPTAPQETSAGAESFRCLERSMDIVGETGITASVAVELRSV